MSMQTTLSPFSRSPRFNPTPSVTAIEKPFLSLWRWGCGEDVLLLGVVSNMLRHKPGPVLGGRLDALVYIDPPAPYGPPAGNSPTYLPLHPLMHLVLTELFHLLLAGL